MLSLSRSRRRASATRILARHTAAILPELQYLEPRRLLAGGPLEVTITELQTNQSVTIVDNGTGDSSSAVGVINYSTPTPSPFTDFVIKGLTVYSNRTTATTLASMSQTGIISRSTSAGGNATLEISAMDPNWISPTTLTVLNSAVSGTFTNAAANQVTTTFQSAIDTTTSPTGTLTSNGIAPDSHDETASPTDLFQSAPYTVSNVTTITLGQNTSASNPITDQYTSTTTAQGNNNRYDLAITKSDNVGGVIVPGQENTVVFTIVASNAGPSTATDVPVNDTDITSLTGFQSATWTATASAGSSVATPSGTGNIDKVPVTLAVNGTATFTVTAHLKPEASGTGTTSNTATVGRDTVTPPTPGDNTATDTLTLTTPCPTVADIGRIGVHCQQTRLIVTFSGVVNPTLAENPTSYSVITKTGQRIRIKSATYHPATNSVTLIPAIRLDVHLRFLLSVLLPCAPGTPSHTVLVPFGGKMSLIGFYNKCGEFVVVHHARIIGFYNHRGEFIAVHNVPLIRAERLARRNEVAHPIHRNPPDFRRRGLLEFSKRGSHFARPARNPLYDKVLSSWTRFEFTLPNHSGQGKTKARMTEVLFLSPNSDPSL
jgi:hypothetical protein